MGILDDLKQQADTLRAREAEDANRKTEQEAYYRNHLRPTMLRVMSYLDELIKHINYVQPEKIIFYPLAPDRKSPIALQQSHYRLVIDSSESPRKVDVRVVAELVEPQIFDIQNTQAIGHYAEHLNSHGIKFHQRNRLNTRHQLDGATFTLEGPLHLAIRFQADAEEQKIIVHLRNFGSVGVRRHSYQADKITNEFLDRVGRLILHDIDTLTTQVKLPEELLNNLREQLAKQ